MDTMEEMKAFLLKKKNERYLEHEKLKAEKRKLEETIKTTAEMMDKAFEDGDADKYISLKRSNEDVEIRLQIIQTKMQTMSSGGKFLTPEEYRQYLDPVKEEYGPRIKEEFDAIRKNIEDCYNRLLWLNDYISPVNSLIRDWQRGFYGSNARFADESFSAEQANTNWLYDRICLLERAKDKY